MLSALLLLLQASVDVNEIVRQVELAYKKADRLIVVGSHKRRFSADEQWRTSDFELRYIRWGQALITEATSKKPLPRALQIGIRETPSSFDESGKRTSYKSPEEAYRSFGMPYGASVILRLVGDQQLRLPTPVVFSTTSHKFTLIGKSEFNGRSSYILQDSYTLSGAGSPPTEYWIDKDTFFIERVCSYAILTSPPELCSELVFNTSSSFVMRSNWLFWPPGPH